MTLPTAQLYLGCPLNDHYETLLSKLDPSLRNLFINSSDEYLQEITFRNKRFLGKTVGAKVTLDQLRLLEVNIHSLLAKLFPHHSSHAHPLKLFSSLE